MNEGFYRIQKTMVGLMHRRTVPSVATSASDTSASTTTLESFCNKTLLYRIAPTPVPVIVDHKR